jgi:hypothetical protein
VCGSSWARCRRSCSSLSAFWRTVHTRYRSDLSGQQPGPAKAALFDRTGQLVTSFGTNGVATLAIQNGDSAVLHCLDRVVVNEVGSSSVQPVVAPYTYASAAVECRCRRLRPRRRLGFVTSLGYGSVLVPPTPRTSAYWRRTHCRPHRPAACSGPPESHAVPRSHPEPLVQSGSRFEKT